MKCIFTIGCLWIFTSSLYGETDFSAAEAKGKADGLRALKNSGNAIAEADLKTYITRLASIEYGGRGTGDPGERMATAYFASFMEGLGMETAGVNNTYFQPFDFTAAKRLDGVNTLTLNQDEPINPGKSYQPLSISASGSKVQGGLVFAGFGIRAGRYDSYQDLDVKGKWVLVLRGHPTRRTDLRRFAPLVSKSNAAKELGAAGIIFVKAGNAKILQDVIPPSISVGGSSILPALTLSDQLAESLLPVNTELTTLFQDYDTENKTKGFPIDSKLSATINLATNTISGRNVLARLVVGDEPSEETIMIGGHIDHVGRGNRGTSLAKGEAAKKIHVGADDNASGISAIMEIAQLFAIQKEKGELEHMKRDIIFAAWSGEEMGLWGSRFFVADQKESTQNKIYPKIAAYLNLDMVGRASQNGLKMQGTGSSGAWEPLLNSIEMKGLEIELSASPFSPTDSTPFYQEGIPILAAFTGIHPDYHRPSDTVDKIDFDGLGKITKYIKKIAEKLSENEDPPNYVKVSPNNRRQAAPKVKLGFVPQDTPRGHGVRIMGITANSSAANAGLKSDDIITSLNGEPTHRIESLFRVLTDLKAGREYEAEIKRGDETLKVKITPEKR